ncbi:Membrane protein [Vibrio mytili]
MLILLRILKLVIICVIFFTIFDLIAYGEITWLERLLGSFS